MSPESIAFRQKRRIKNARNKYMNPGALVQLSCSRTTTRSCADVGMKRVILESKEEMDKLHQNEIIQDSIPTVSPVRVYLHPATEVSKQPKQPQTPKTQHAVNSDGLSRLESLPMDLLVKILCYLHHDQLRAVFHVCQQVRTAVLLARKQHFNYTTPDRSRQGMCRNRTPVPSEHWPFVRKEGGKGMWVSSPHTPRAPRQGPRPPRLHIMDMKQISAVLFQESTLSPRRIAPPGLPRPLFKAVASTRVLIYEDELCQAVTHNKLR